MKLCDTCKYDGLYELEKPCVIYSEDCKLYEEKKLMDKFKTTSIKFTSRASVKIKDNFYTFEAVIEKECPKEYTEEEYIDAKTKLWEEANAEVDGQINDIIEYLKNKR